MITPFGIATRKLRLDKGLRLLDLAEKLKLSSSFISAVETGKKPIPSGYVDSVVAAMRLTRPEAAELQRAAARSKTVVDIDHARVELDGLALHDLPPEFLEEIKKQVFKSIAGDIPFKRRHRGLLVAAASTRALWDFAEKVRSVFVGEAHVCFPIMDVLEFRLPAIEEGFHLEVCSLAEMGVEEGLVIANFKCIKLREDVYEGAWNDVGRDRFTACHELGHYLLHRQVAIARIRDDSHPVYRDAEWQADTFAGGLLMSTRHLAQLGCADAAAAQCGMTPMAANVMWSKYHKEGFLPP